MSTDLNSSFNERSNNTCNDDLKPNHSNSKSINFESEISYLTNNEYEAMDKDYKVLAKVIISTFIYQCLIEDGYFKKLFEMVRTRDKLNNEFLDLNEKRRFEVLNKIYFCVFLLF